MKDTAALEHDAIRKIVPPHRADGWVRCVSGAPYFETELGAAWSPVGHNEAITWPHLAPLYRRRDLAGVDQHFAMLKAHGVNCLRLMLEYSQVRHRHLESRCGQFSPAMVRLWDDMIVLGERHDIRFLLTPFDTFFLCRRWEAHPYARRNGGPSDSPRTLFLCPDTRAAIINRLLFATRRWGHSPAIFAWDLWNEIESYYSGGDMGAVHDFVSEVSAALRDEEVRLHGRSHLQTVSVFLPVLDKQPGLADIAYRHPALDFASVHLYEKGTIDFPRNSLAPAMATVRLMAEAAAQCPAERPLLDSEHGPIHSFKDRRITLAEDFDTECFRRTQWAHLASGGAGGGMRWPYRQPHVLLPAMHQAQRLLADFLPLIDWQRLRRKPLGDRLRTASYDGLACGCGDDTQAIICLMPAPTKQRHDPNLVPDLLDLTGFRPGSFSVTQMDTVTGNRETSHVESRPDGTLTIDVGERRHDLALALVRTGDTIT